MPPAVGTILLVEDESAVRSTARRILERRGYSVLEARHGADAMVVWGAHRAKIDAVVTDIRMPEVGGRELVEALSQEQPHLPIVFMSGYSDEQARATAGPWQTFIERPFTTERLTTALASVLATSR